MQTVRHNADKHSCFKVPDSYLIRQAAADHIGNGAKTVQKNKENENEKWRNHDKKITKRRRERIWRR